MSKKQKQAANPDQKTLRDEWRASPLAGAGITGKLAEKLHAAHIDTLGKLQDLMGEHGAWWFKEVNGIGKQTAAWIGELFNRFITRHVKD